MPQGAPTETVPFDGHGAFVAPLGVDLSGAAAVMITLEDEGGATGRGRPAGDLRRDLGVIYE